MTQEEDNRKVNNLSDNPPDNTVRVKTELEILAEEKAELQGYRPSYEITYEHGFIDGYQEAQKTMFTEDDLREAIDKARNISAMFASKEDIIRLIKENKNNQNDTSRL